MSEATTDRQDQLQMRLTVLKAENPNIRFRDAADRLGVSEAELLATDCGGKVTRLRPKFQDILGGFAALGTLKGITRNEDVVHEKEGEYENLSFHANGRMGMFVNERIDQRLFMHHWAKAFAVEDEIKGKRRLSVQFFGKDGTALHKAFSTHATDMDAFDALIARFRAEDQSAAEPVEAAPGGQSEVLPDESIDREGFQQAWRALQDTHDFHFMLRNYKLDRQQALRLAPEGFTRPLPVDSLPCLMEGMRDAGLNIMVFVGNPGVVQIHSGPIKKLVRMEPWYNVLDPGFHLHIREEAINAIWVVRKPTEKGIVTGIECFNAAGELIITFFGKRKAGESEMPAWRKLVEQLEQELAG